jgi:hypothetical protein
MSKLEMEIKADASVRSREELHDQALYLSKETKELGLMRMAFCLDFMYKSVSFDRPKPEYEKYIGMFPVLKVEVRNTEYVVRMLLGEPFDLDKFEKLKFFGEKRPDPPSKDVVKKKTEVFG